MPKLSIIVPIFDVEAYLNRCVDSILGQTFTDFEAILIDDGSHDHCAEIVDEYMQKDSRIISIHQKNKGVSAARNAGLRIATGKYIGFVDPDDWIEPEMYATLIHDLETSDSDIAVCAWMNNDDHGNESQHERVLAKQIIGRDEFTQHLFDMPPTIAGSTCNKLFKKKLITSRFDTAYYICEDNLFLASYVINIRKASVDDKALYHIYCRDRSATRQNPDRVALGLPARREIIDIVKSINNRCRMRAESVFLDQCLTYCAVNRKKETLYYRLARDELIGYVRTHLISVLRNTEMTVSQKLYIFRSFFRLMSEKMEQ